MKVKFTWRIWLLIILVLLSILAISPTFKSGVLVKSVEQNSPAQLAGISPGEVIISVNGQSISNLEDYSNIISSINFNGSEKRLDIITKTNDYTLFINQTPRLSVSNIPKTKIQTGLDLRGGSRALVQAEQDLTDSQLDDLIAVSRNRFNVFGLSDVQVKGVSDLAGNKYMLVEIAGASPQDLEKLIGQQGKFEAKIANQTVFIGGNKDISDVCRNDARCAAVTSCQGSSGQYSCNFQFTVYLTEASAERHANITKQIPLDDTGRYLTEKIYLYVDDQEVDSLLISSSLRGQVTTQISIQGSGSGATQEDAVKNTRAEMNKLQTILITGSLPYKLNIVKLDSISPILGGNFIYLLFLAGFSSIVLVSLIVFIRYRKFKASIALLLTSFSELLIILGVAAVIGWNLDLPSIAGILATIGTGVDQQIVILDESVKEKSLNIKERMKRALFIIMGSYSTALVSLLPLYWAGAGLFKGFAFTTILGITAGVLLTRPAFADFIRTSEE